ncbi:MAG: hypothetical protein ACLFUB_16005, partial [Cyclobacteriaceae bacterium]
DDDDDDDDDECEFDDDEDDDDGDGDDDEPEDGEDVRSQGVEINTANGAIDLRQTILNGALGNEPANGVNKDFTIYYRLYDASDGALNSITVRLYYYDDLSAVPQDLLDEIEERRNSLSVLGARKMAYRNKIARLSRGGRPPYIVIVGRASL